MLMSFSSVFFYPLLSAILWTGELWDFLSFTERYPSIIYTILLFAVTSALGQVGGSFGLWPSFDIVLQRWASWNAARWNDIALKFLCQTFIFLTVVNFGPLTCSIVTTTRKFFTILGSVILFGNAMSVMQWVGTILVFLGESQLWFKTGFIVSADFNSLWNR